MNGFGEFPLSLIIIISSLGAGPVCTTPKTLDSRGANQLRGPKGRVSYILYEHYFMKINR